MQITDVIHSWPCHTFLVNCSYKLDIMANEAEGRSIYWSTLKMSQHLQLLIVGVCAIGLGLPLNSKSSRHIILTLYL